MILFSLLPLAAQSVPELLSLSLQEYSKGNYSQALSGFSYCARQGDKLAQFYLGVIYDIGKGIPVDKTKAFQWFLKLADQGVMEAQYNVAIMLYKGEGTTQDVTQAVTVSIKKTINTLIFPGTP